MEVFDEKLVVGWSQGRVWFCTTRRFITVLTKTPKGFILSQLNPLQTFTPHFFFKLSRFYGSTKPSCSVSRISVCFTAHSSQRPPPVLKFFSEVANSISWRCELSNKHRFVPALRFVIVTVLRGRPSSVKFWLVMQMAAIRSSETSVTTYTEPSAPV